MTRAGSIGKSNGVAIYFRTDQSQARLEDRRWRTAPPRSLPQTPTEAVTPGGINHLVINVRDMEESHRFWTEILGFKEVGTVEPAQRCASTAATMAAR